MIIPNTVYNNVVSIFQINIKFVSKLRKKTTVQ
jgi:hypothetical protein